MLVKNIKIALAVTISLSFLCLVQTACKIGPANPPDKHTSSSAPTKSGRKHESTLLTSSEGKKKGPFTLALEDATQEEHKNNFVIVTITPKSAGMKLEDFSITASCPENNGTLRGAGGKNTGGGYKYNKDLSEKPTLGDIYLVSKNQLDRSFEQGEAVTFRLRFEPGAGTKKGENYNLTVTVTQTHQGNILHTEKQDIQLTAPKTYDKKKVSKKHPIKKASQNRSTKKVFSNGSGTLRLKNKTSNRAQVSTRQPEEGAIPSGQTLPKNGSETDSPNDAGTLTLAPEDVKKSNSKKDSTEISKNKQEKRLPDSTGTFTLELNQVKKTKDNYFITVKITPVGKGMELAGFSITASCPENKGTLMGAGGKNTKGYKYNKDLSKKPKLGDICLVSKNQLLGKEDHSFEKGEAVTFRLKFQPGGEIKKGNPYKLKVTVTDNKGNSKTEDITLTEE